MKSRKLNKIKVFSFFVVIGVLVVFFLMIQGKDRDDVIVIRKKMLKSKEVYYNPEYDEKYITQVNEINLSHEGIHHPYQFVFMTDLQANVIDEELKDEEIKQSITERYQEFVSQNPNQVGQKEIFDEIISYTNQMDADALLLGGDIIDCPTKSNLNLLRQELKQNLKVRYLYTLGNHDWSFMKDYHSEKTEKTYYPKFKEFMNDLQVSYLEYEDLIILSINDGKGQFEQETIPKVKKVLEKKKPTIVMIHVPLSTKWITEEEIRIRARNSAIGEYGVEPNESSQEIIDLILSEEYDVFYILTGHLHFSIKDDLNERITEETGDPAFQGIITVIRIDNQEEEKQWKIF